MEKLGTAHLRAARCALQLSDFKAAMTTIPKEEARTIFDRAMDHTRTLSPGTFDQWFGGVQFDDLTDGVLTLRVQNEFVLEWVKTNYLPTVIEKIRELSGWSVQVAWCVGGDLDRPRRQRPRAAFAGDRGGRARRRVLPPCLLYTSPSPRD